jgi:hypothetical protein
MWYGHNLAMFVVIAMLVWMTVAVTRTVRYLRSLQAERANLRRYASLRSIFGMATVASMVTLVSMSFVYAFSFTFMMSPYYVGAFTHWQLYVAAFQDVIYFLVLFSITYLWRPRANALEDAYLTALLLNTPMEYDADEDFLDEGYEIPRANDTNSAASVTPDASVDATTNMDPSNTVEGDGTPAGHHEEDNDDNEGHREIV